jgi:GAF domain-containing protein
MERPDLEQLYDLAKELKKAKTIKAVLDIVADHLPKVLGARYCSLFIKNPMSCELELKAHNHQDIGDDPFIHIAEDQESIMNLVLSRNTSMLVRNIEEEIGIVNKDKYSTKSFMCLLISFEDRVLGVLNLADKSPSGFTREDMLMASIITELLGSFLARHDLSKI